MSTPTFIGIDFSNSALLAEIKELAEKNQYEDGMALLCIAAGYEQPIIPDMEFEFNDDDIQEDLCQLVEYSSGELCTPEQRDKVMKIWSTYLEQVFGVPSHPLVTEDKDENTVKAINDPIAESVNNIGEEISIPPADVDNVANKDDILLCNAPESEPMQIDANMMPAKLWANKHVGGFLEEGASSSAEVKKLSEENVSDALKGPDYADGSRGIEAIPSQGPLDCVITEPTSSAFAKDKKYRKETEAYAKNEGEEGEWSPNGNFEKVEEQMFTEWAPEENDAMTEDEGKESASDGSENGSEENRDVSASESANGKGVDDNDDKADESEGEVNVRENGRTLRFFDRFLKTAKPLAIKVQTKAHDKEENLRIFYGNDSFYLLFRLHQMLYESMLSVKLHSSLSENGWRFSNDVKQTDSYTRFKDALRSLLNGSSDNAKFEDQCRAIIGAQSCVLFTLDKLIQKLVKQLQTIASNEMDNKLLDLYAYERLRNHETFSEEVYCANARFIILDENLYRMECLSCPVRLTIQLMINEHDKFEQTAFSMDHDVASYLNEELLAAVPQRMGKPGVFLKRNKKGVYNGDEISNFDKAMEGLIVHNGIEIKVNRVTKKIAYVLGTEDFLYRKKSRRQALYHASPCDASSSAASNGNWQSIKRGKLLFS